MHIGTHSRNCDYVMEDQQMTEVDHKRGLGILIATISSGGFNWTLATRKAIEHLL